VDRQAVAVVDLPLAVGLGEQLQVVEPLPLGLLGVAVLVQGEVAVDDVGDPQRAGGRVRPGALEDLVELGGGDLLVRLALGAGPGQANLAAVHLGHVAAFLGGIPRTGMRRHD
jgi:hypothetical protein